MLTSPALASSTSTPSEAECAVSYMQGEVRICIPELTNVNKTVGYVYASWKTPTTVEFAVGVSKSVESAVVLVTVELFNENMTPLYSGSIPVTPGEVKTFEYTAPEGARAIVYRFVIEGEELVGALLVPKPLELVPPEYAKNPLVMLLVGLVPVSLVLGYFLTNDLRDAAVLTFASISCAYILLNFVSPSVASPWITMIVGLALLFTVVYYVVSR